jgi:hypothetical protein
VIQAEARARKFLEGKIAAAKATEKPGQ